MSVSLLLGLVYLISELLLTVTRRSRNRTGTKQDRSTLRVVWLVTMVSVAAGIYAAKPPPRPQSNPQTAPVLRLKPTQLLTMSG